MPLLFCVPVALITAELAGMHPVSGGQAAFVERAFGAGVGLQNACWVLLVVLADASIYPQLGEAYARELVPSNRWAPVALKVAMVLATAAAHAGGASATERASAVVGASVLWP
jgi:amino acid transporter